MNKEDYINRAVPTISEDCISREFALEVIDDYINYPTIGDKYCAIKNAPSVTPTEKTGEWIEHKYAEEYDGLMQSNFECSKCHDWLREQTNYCPICGARMNKGGDDNG